MVGAAVVAVEADMNALATGMQSQTDRRYHAQHLGLLCVRGTDGMGGCTAGSGERKRAAKGQRGRTSRAEQ